MLRRPVASRLVNCTIALGTMLLVVGVMASAADACPTCKAALASHDGAHGDIVGAYFWSILFMMSMPFTILGILSGIMYWQIRRARAVQSLPRESAATATQAPQPATSPLASPATFEASEPVESREETVGV
jgi:hypothetical protein